MKTKLITVATVAVVALSFSLALACSFNTDCTPGSKCVKAAGSIYGVCAGGISPGNQNDRQPVRSRTDPNDTYGNTCSFNSDCGPRSKCAKSSGSVYGVCVKR